VSARARTHLPSGPVRFGLEAGFIVLAGVIAAVLELSAIAIVIVMGLAWVVVALVERAARATRARPRRARELVRRPAVEPRREAPLEQLPGAEREPRRLRFYEPPHGQTVAPSSSTTEWNLWELERRARDYAAGDAVPEEWAAMFMHLREFANSDGRLPERFDSLVRESFPELTTG
jgi:hypothetical protein